MNRSLQIRGALCVIAILLSVYLLLPTFKAASYSSAEREAAKTDPVLKAEIDAADEKAIRRGLDLQGGMYLVLEIDVDDMSPEQATDAMARVREILTNRVDQFGVSEPVIQTVGNSRIIVQLPGLQDPERAKRLIGSTARLEFRLLAEAEETRRCCARLDEAFRTVGGCPRWRTRPRPPPSRRRRRRGRGRRRRRGRHHQPVRRPAGPRTTWPGGRRRGLLDEEHPFARS